MSLAAGGAAAFFLLLALAVLQPVTIEKWARAAIANEVQDRVTVRLQSLDDTSLVKAAERIVARHNDDLEQAKAAMAAQLPSRIAQVMDAMLHPDCPCRLRSISMDRIIQQGRISSFETANAHLTRMIESKYHDVAQSLLREVKIFCAANGSVFLLLALTAWRWTRSSLQLLAPAGVMGGAVALTCSVYLFKQDWLHTILFSDYVGFYYIPYLLVALGFLADVVFNRGRYTLALLGGALALAGGLFGVTAC